MFQNMYTPEEVARMKAQLEQNYQNGALQNQNLNTAASMAKNLNLAANLGILLGTLGGKWAANQYNNLQQIQNEKNIARTNWQNLKENGLYSGLMNLPDYQFSPYSPYTKNPFNPQSSNTAPSTALNPPSTNFVPNNAAPSTALFANETPYFDWRNQNYLTHQVTRPQYLSIR